MKKSFEVEIFGKKYRFRGVDPERISQCAELLNERLTEVHQDSRSIDLHTTFSVAAMKITEDYFTVLDKLTQLEAEVDSINQELKQFIEENKL